MKKLLLILAVVGCATISCKKAIEGDTFNFDQSLAPYVEISSKTGVKVTEGNSFNVTAVMRTAQVQPVTVTYSITGGTTPVIGIITIPANSVSARSAIPIPAGTVPAGSTTVAAVFRFTKATLPNADTLTIGRYGAAKEVIAVTVSK